MGEMPRLAASVSSLMAEERTLPPDTTDSNINDLARGTLA